jgi:hypothetical protein
MITAQLALSKEPGQEDQFHGEAKWEPIAAVYV